MRNIIQNLMNTVNGLLSSDSNNPMGKLLAMASYGLYALAALLLVALILILTVFGKTTDIGVVNRPNTIVSGQIGSVNDFDLPGNFNEVGTQESTDNKVASTANHQPITDITPDDLQKLADIYNTYSFLGLCPGDSEEMEYEESKRFMRNLGWSDDDAGAYSVCRMTKCHSVADMKEHIRIYLTEDVATTLEREAVHHKHLEKDGELYYFVPAMGWPGYNYIGGSMAPTNNGCTALFSTDYTEEIVRFTFVPEDGVYKVANVEKDTSSAYPMYHPQFDEMNESTAEALVQIYRQYDMYGICPGDFISVSSDCNEEIFQNIGLTTSASSSYSIYCSDTCFTLADVEEHIRYYLTDDLADGLIPPTLLIDTHPFYLFEYDNSVYYAVANMGYAHMSYDAGSLVNVGNKWQATATYMDEGDVYPAGTFTFIKEHGLYKVCSFEAAR